MHAQKLILKKHYAIFFFLVAFVFGKNCETTATTIRRNKRQKKGAEKKEKPLKDSLFVIVLLPLFLAVCMSPRLIVVLFFSRASNYGRTIFGLRWFRLFHILIQSRSPSHGLYLALLRLCVCVFFVHSFFTHFYLPFWCCHPIEMFYNASPSLHAALDPFAIYC